VPIKDATTTGGNAPMMVKGAVASTLVARTPMHTLAHTCLHTFLRTMVILRLSMRPTLLIAHLPVDSGEMVQAHGEVQ